MCKNPTLKQGKDANATQTAQLGVETCNLLFARQQCKPTVLASGLNSAWSCLFGIKETCIKRLDNLP